MLKPSKHHCANFMSMRVSVLCCSPLKQTMSRADAYNSLEETLKVLVCENFIQCLGKEFNYQLIVSNLHRFKVFIK